MTFETRLSPKSLTNLLRDDLLQETLEIGSVELPQQSLILQDPLNILQVIIIIQKVEHEQLEDLLVVDLVLEEEIIPDEEHLV